MKKIKITSFIVVLSVIIYLIIHFQKSTCLGNDAFYNTSFKGIVTKKYLDHKQHSIPVIDILDPETQKIRTIDFFLDIPQSYDKINISDVISKADKSMDIYIKKDGKISFLTKVNFECTD